MGGTEGIHRITVNLWLGYGLALLLKIMGNTRCKICFSPFREKIETWAMQGYSATKIAHKYCRDIGFTVSHQTVSRHLALHTDIAITTNDLMEGRKLEPVKDTDLNPEVATLEEINSVFDELGLPHDLCGISLEQLITACQQITARTYLRQCALVDVLQRKYADGGRATHPTDQIKSLKILQECMAVSWAYPISVNLTQAAKILEAEGYEILPPKFLREADTIDIEPN